MSGAAASLSRNLSSDRAVERLTALWALAEAGMGGFVHALKIPFTAGVIGGAAVILISTIGFFAEKKAAAIFRATMIVVLIKAAVSPHSPLPAYFAVLFQGLIGAALFGLLPWPQLAAMLLALLAFWEGAAQKLLVMTFIYGHSLWDSLDLAGQRLLEVAGGGSSSLSPTAWFLLVYGAYYTLGGVITGWLAATLPAEIARAASHIEPQTESPAGIEPTWNDGPRRKPWWRRTPIKAGVAAFVLSVILAVLSPDGQGLERGLRMFLRAVVAIAIWVIAIRPLTQWLFRLFQRREQSRYAADVQHAMNLLPTLRAVAAKSWSRAADLSGWRRWKRFLVDLAAHALAE